jgi:hypothetical protein
LRGVVNERGDFLITTLPVFDLEETPSGAAAIAEFADGGGWTTHVVLVNPSDAAVNGSVQFINNAGSIIQTTPYALAPRSSARIVRDGSSPNPQTGSIRILSPVFAFSVMSYTSSDVTVTQTAIPILNAAERFRMYVESGPGLRTAVAIANTSASATEVNLEASGLTAALSIPANGQTAMFLDEAPGFSSLAAAFQGVLRITSAAPITVTGLRFRTNERGEFLITTTAAVDESASAPASAFIPYWIDGAGYSTQFVLFGRATSGALLFLDSAGNPAPLPFR